MAKKSATTAAPKTRKRAPRVVIEAVIGGYTVDGVYAGSTTSDALDAARTAIEAKIDASLGLQKIAPPVEVAG